MVQRYDVATYSSALEPDDEGQFVQYEDYAELEMQLLALRKEREATVPNKQEPLLKCSTRTYAPPAQPVVVPTFEEWCERTEQKPVGWVREAMRDAYEGCRAAMLKEAK